MAKVSSTSKPKRPKIDFERLNRWNGIAGVVFLLQAVAIVVAATGKNFPVVLNFLGADKLASEAKGHEVTAAATHRLFDMSLPWALALSLAASAVLYFLVASYLRTLYEQGLTKRINTVRWVGYGASSGLLLVALGLLLGVQSAAALLALFALTFGASGLYAIAEKYNQKAPSAATCNYWLGSAFGLIAWVVLALYAWGGHVYGAGVAGFVSLASAVVFLLQVAIAVNFYLQLHAKGKWADYMFGEKSFMVINFVMLSVTAWIIFAGSLRP